MIEINWGKPIIFVLSPKGDTKKFTTIEQARYWLCKKWPITDHSRDLALNRIDAAMQCMGTVGAARKAFVLAAKTAGFKPDQGSAEAVAGC